jgi:hypothetical protein
VPDATVVGDIKSMFLQAKPSTPFAMQIAVKAELRPCLLRSSKTVLRLRSLIESSHASMEDFS